MVNSMTTWLIAEDEADIRTLIATMCAVWGHETMLFENGGLVWEWLDKVESGSHDGQMPDLILLDIRMPGKKGDEIARRMRSMPAFDSLPVVLMTAFSLDDQERGNYLNTVGVDYIVNKPLPDFEEFRVLLHNIVERKRTA
jgi:CheY-like chemotaxis protein